LNQGISEHMGISRYAVQTW